ncbi:MAG: XRE family transcriptional regulator [Clostridia bacterium]|nr:XRE family transcriptional regulator [Clostridia bacterium]
MDTNIKQIAARIRELREILEFSPAEVAQAVGLTLEQYSQIEDGQTDLSFTMLSRLAAKLRVDLTDLVSGESPRLGVYTVTRKGRGAKLTRRAEYNYEHLFESMSARAADAFVVTVEYDAARLQPESMYRHDGQEINFMLEGTMDFFIDDRRESLAQGDAVFFDAGHPHAMCATGGARAVFLSVIVKEDKK